MPHWATVVLTLLSSGALFLLGRRWPRLPQPARGLVLGAALLLAIPGLLLALYYTHLLDRALWFYQLRALPFTELTGAGVGLLAGIIHSRVAPESLREGWAVPVLAAAVILAPHLKPLLAPVDISRMKDRWEQGVCLQSTPSTCGPSSAATILRALGKPASERELAQESLTSASGTEIWYLARALRRRGLTAEFVLQSPGAPPPSYAIAGVTLPRGLGHSIAVLQAEGGRITVADPMVGPRTFDSEGLAKRYRFTGFFLEVRR